MPTSSEQRPDPDLLLARVRQQEAQEHRGKLRIYFGSSAGVGKTYAMLAAARKFRSEGREVVVGVVETHGRSETAALLDELEILPPKAMSYRGKELTEFDLDAALQRRPALMLVDELAHSNVQGVRHPKRWQDVEEMLAAGIDVFTTLNVQHLESLNDVVGGITNVRVWETVPDTVFDGADEVVLVDIPADELLARLKAGKVYVPHQAERAANNFFRKGNLMALRELALRRTADRVEGDVQAYRVDKSIGSVWKTATALLTCVGPDPGAERVLVNLLENASKYTPPGSTVSLSAEIVGDRLSFSVSDNGPGLPLGREEAVFQKFTRGERESATPGVGLGLAICRAIVESHQGKIVAANRAEGGAIFTFTLPLGIPPVAAPETDAAHG